jgi:hypothetical protein
MTDHDISAAGRLPAGGTRQAAAPDAAPAWQRGALLYAIAPPPLAPAAAFGPARIGRLAAVACAAVLVAGIGHTGRFFVLALVAMEAGAVKLGRERVRS